MYVPDNAVPNIQAQLNHISKQLEKIMATLADLQNAVAAETTVETSAITLLNGIAAQLTAALANQLDPNAVQSVITNIQSSSAALAAAVAANTPAAPPTPAPTPSGS